MPRDHGANGFGLFGLNWAFPNSTVFSLGQVVVGMGSLFSSCVCVCVEGTSGDYIMSRLTAICIRVGVCEWWVRGRSVTEESVCRHRQYPDVSTEVDTGVRHEPESSCTISNLHVPRQWQLIAPNSGALLRKAAAWRIVGGVCLEEVFAQAAALAPLRYIA